MKLSSEQEQYVVENLELKPEELTAPQKKYLLKHWNKKIIDLEEYYTLFPNPEPTEEDKVFEKQFVEQLNKAAAFSDKQKELFDRLDDVPEAEWLIEAIAVKQGITMLFGDKGQGKTTLILQLIGSLQENKDMLSLKVGKVIPLLIEQDENPSILRNHVNRLLPVYPSLNNILVPKDTLTWNNEKTDFSNPQLLLDLIKYSRANLVIIDSLSSLNIEDVNHPRGAAIFDKLRILAKKLDCAFLLLHHPNKNGEVMGSNLIQAKCDVILRLNERRLIFHKLRGNLPKNSIVNDGALPHFLLSQNQTTLQFSLSNTMRSKSRTAYIQELLSQKKSRTDIINLTLKEFQGNRETVAKAVDRVKKQTNIS
jgi:archaellum biogenesis ATPase FlaH